MTTPLAKKHICLLLFTLWMVATGFAQSPTTKTLRIFFATGKIDLSTDAKLRLDSLADSLPQHLRYEIRLRGHSDSQGDSLANLALSERRTKTVQTYLAQRKIVAQEVKSVGQQEPQLRAQTLEALALNRRVEIWVRYTPKPEQDIPVATETAVNKPPQPKSTILDLYALMADPPQEFCIDPSRDTFIVCKQGTVISFPASAFKLQPPCTENCVTIHVKEVFEKSQMIIENLSTTSNGRILESQGMLFTEAMDCQGRPLQLQPDKDMVVMQPAGKVVPGAKVFDGRRERPDSMMNWLDAPNSKLNSFKLKDLNECGFNCGGSCNFFFCQIRLFFLKLFRVKPKPRPMQVPSRLKEYCADMTALFLRYGVKNSSELRNALNRNLLDRLGFKTIEEMYAKLKQEEIDSREMRFQNGALRYEDFQYFIYNTPTLGWKNVDVFANVNPRNLIDMKIDIPSSPEYDCKLVFMRRRTVLPPDRSGSTILFRGAPKGEIANLVALKYEDGKAYLCIKKVEITPGPFAVEFEMLEIEALKARLRMLNL